MDKLPFRAVLADDEDFARVTLKSLVDWDRLGIRIVGEADNGLDALRLVKELKPELLFLDIRMPGMSGLEVLEALEPEDSLSIVVLSSYNDFDSVRSALRLGASDYLHKPELGECEITEILTGLLEQVEQRRREYRERETLKKEVRRSHQALKPLFLKEVLLNPDGQSITAAQLEEYDIRISAPFQCLFLSVDNNQDIMDRYEPENLYLYHRSIENILGSLSFEHVQIEFEPVGNGRYALFLSFGFASAHGFEESGGLIAKRLQKTFSQFLNIRISVGISAVHRSIGELRQASLEAESALGMKFFSGHGALIQYRPGIAPQEEAGPGDLGRVQHGLRSIRESLQRKDPHRAAEEIALFLDNIASAPGFPEKAIRKYCFDIYCMLNDLFKSILDAENRFDLSFYPPRILLSLESIQDIRLFFDRCVSLLKDQLISIHAFEIRNQLVRNCIDYITMNYMDAELTLTVLSEELSVNKSYLSRVFKKETDRTVTEYINICRIDKAKYFLRQSDRKIYRISGMVGFNSVEYFSMIFKKMTGVTPGQFRNFCEGDEESFPRKP